MKRATLLPLSVALLALGAPRARALPKPPAMSEIAQAITDLDVARARALLGQTRSSSDADEL